jgi:hypothetical protein
MKTRIIFFGLIMLLGCGGDDSYYSASTPDEIPQEGEWSIHITWDPNMEPDLAGYHLYQSTISGHYTTGAYIATIPSGIETYTIEHLRAGSYFWVLSAFDTVMRESDFSDEVSIVLGPASP